MKQEFAENAGANLSNVSCMVAQHTSNFHCPCVNMVVPVQRCQSRTEFSEIRIGACLSAKVLDRFFPPKPSLPAVGKCDDENLQRSSTWINPYQEQFLRKQTSDLGKPGRNGDCLFFENNGGFDISYTGHLDGKTANSTDFPSYRCIVLHVISCLSHSTL